MPQQISCVYYFQMVLFEIRAYAGSLIACFEKFVDVKISGVTRILMVAQDSFHLLGDGDVCDIGVDGHF